MKEIIGVIAVLLAFISYAPYIRDVIKGQTKPHVYSWFVWGFVSLIIFALQLSDGGGMGSYVTLSGAVIALLIFVLGMRNGKRDITMTDTVFFISNYCNLCLVICQPGSLVGQSSGNYRDAGVCPNSS